MSELLEYGPELVRDLKLVAVSADSAPMARYMKDQFSFLGVKAKARRIAQRPAMALARRSTPDEVAEWARWCWAQPYRELQYTACDTLRANVKRMAADTIGLARELVTAKSWWDTVDTLASNTIGPLVRDHPELIDTMDDWIDEEDFWLARVSILHQLQFKENTDADRLFSYCRARQHDREFFIRKSIGWALRQYSKQDPGAVASFLTDTPSLCPLSVREASRYL